MRKFRFNKLIRDGIFDSIIDGGGKVDYRILNDNEMLEEAKKKLVEEVQEFVNAGEEELAGELSDIQELIDLICTLKGIPTEELKQIQSKKAAKAGTFQKRIYVNTVQVPDDSKWIDYYLTEPDRYPEVK